MSNVIFSRFRETTIATEAEPTEQSATCGICLSDLAEQPEGLEHRLNRASSHRFHRDCLERWLDVQKACPLCSRRVTHVDGELLNMSDHELGLAVIADARDGHTENIRRC